MRFQFHEVARRCLLSAMIVWGLAWHISKKYFWPTLIHTACTILQYSLYDIYIYIYIQEFGVVLLCVVVRSSIKCPIIPLLFWQVYPGLQTFACDIQIFSSTCLFYLFPQQLEKLGVLPIKLRGGLGQSNIKVQRFQKIALYVDVKVWNLKVAPDVFRVRDALWVCILQCFCAIFL